MYGWMEGVRDEEIDGRDDWMDGWQEISNWTARNGEEEREKNLVWVEGDAKEKVKTR